MSYPINGGWKSFYGIWHLCTIDFAHTKTICLKELNRCMLLQLRFSMCETLLIVFDSENEMFLKCLVSLKVVL